ncbi:MAG: RecX family transcriptional regulator [Bacteroidetes bacterium]|jgi:regulatory protein|nr:RecX family transcriptional regulator [Bacteroidota bacterium]
MEEKGRKKLSVEEASLKAESYCAYQERCQQEVRDKLYEWGLWPEAIENIIADLITNNFINEERFAKAYAGGKFRIKKWGRIKIKIALKQKRISEYCIKKALQEIDGDDYIKTLEELLEKKAGQSKEKNEFHKRYKLIQYAVSRGYENDLVQDVLKKMGIKEED